MEKAEKVQKTAKTAKKKDLISIRDELPSEGDTLILSDGTKQTVTKCDGRYIYTETAKFRVFHKSAIGFARQKKTEK